MGKEWEAQIFGARVGMTALALLAAVTAIVIAVMVGSQMRALVAGAPTPQGTSAPAGALGYEPAE